MARGTAECYTWEITIPRAVGAKVRAMSEREGWPGIAKDPIQEGSPEGQRDLNREKLEVWRKE